MSSSSTVDARRRVPFLARSIAALALSLLVEEFNSRPVPSRREHHRELGGTPCTFDALESFEGSGGGQVLAPLVLVNVGATGVDAAEPHGVGDSVSGTKGDDLAGHGGSQDVAALGLEQAGPG